MGPPDAEPPDAEPLDAEPLDAEPRDAEPRDAGSPKTARAHAPAPVRRRDEGPRARRRRRRGGLAFLLAGALPAAAVVWFLLQPAARRSQMLERIPTGVGGRALAAGASFGVMLLLARVALPAFHGTSAALRGVLARLRAAPRALRILLFPVEAIVWTLWFLAQALFAADATLVIAAGLVTLLLALRIVKPDVLPGFLPELTR